MEIIRKIFQDKFAKAAFIILCLLYVLILFADFIAPYSNTYSNRDLSYAPPSKIYTINEKGRLSLPYTYNYVREYDADLMQTVFGAINNSSERESITNPTSDRQTWRNGDEEKIGKAGIYKNCVERHV